MYEQTLPCADRLVITWVEQEPDGDTVFPDVDWSRWQETDREVHEGYAIVTYDRGGPSRPLIPVRAAFMYHEGPRITAFPVSQRT